VFSLFVIDDIVKEVDGVLSCEEVFGIWEFWYYPGVFAFVDDCYLLGFVRLVEYFPGSSLKHLSFFILVLLKFEEFFEWAGN